MNKYIIPRSAQARKSIADLYPATDLICPQPGCRSGGYFSSPAERVWCPTCGWALTLTREQTTEIAEALLGISELPVAQYLLILATQRAGVPCDHQAPVAAAPVYRVAGGVR